jgi:hypothetical protein
MSIKSVQNTNDDAGSKEFAELWKFQKSIRVFSGALSDGGSWLKDDVLIISEDLHAMHRSWLFAKTSSSQTA